jgi:chromosomal replication initiator protein
MNIPKENDERTLSDLWDAVLQSIEQEVSPATYKTWFKETFINGYKNHEVVVGVPSEFVRQWLDEKYRTTVLKKLREEHPSIRSVCFSISRKRTPRKSTAKQKLVTSKNSTMPLQNYYVDKKNNLNPRYTFDNFVIGPFNELAHAAAQAVIKNPGTGYNPLFIYGKTGHGKTHLIQAVGNYIKDNYELSVYYLTSEKFAVDYINSVKTQAVNAFKEKYRRYDVLVMDDVQFLANKEKTQEELFHLFNYLYDTNRQIVFSSDMHPNYVNGLEERLKSRFQTGMIVDIPAPDHESRIALLQAKSQASGVRLDPDVISYLADSIDGNVRELEGIINSIVVQTQLKDRTLNINEVRSLIRNSIKSKKSVSVENVIKVVADYFGIEPELILKKTRRKEIVKPRQIIMYILREDFSIAYPSIGQKIGGRDHTTVIHSYEKIKEELKTDPNLTQQITQLRTMI